MRLKVLRLFVVSTLVFAGMSSVRGVSFQDGFEAATFDPFWSKFELNGAVSLTSSRVHTGSQAAQFATNASGGNKELQLFHYFAAPIFGSASVWVYDAAADAASGNYIEFYATSSGNYVGKLMTQDFDLGASNGGHYDYSTAQGGGSTTVDRTQDWHHFEITSLPDLLRLSVDGVSVFSAPVGTPFDGIAMNVHAPGFRPGLSVQFDDFQLVPEPSSIGLILSGAAAIALACVRHRRCHTRVPS